MAIANAVLKHKALVDSDEEVDFRIFLTKYSLLSADILLRYAMLCCALLYGAVLRHAMLGYDQLFCTMK